MRGLTASEQLRIWERGRRQTPAWRSLMLLAEASPDIPPSELARFAVGQRDSLLLTLRELMFGPEIESVVACPECSDQLELTFDISDVRSGNEPEKLRPDGVFSLTQAGYKVRFRLPDSTDLEEVVHCQNADIARGELVKRCVLDIKRSGKTNKSKIGAGRLPKKVVDALVKRMAEIDPQANVQLSLRCPACQHKWTSNFDIVSFLWGEIDDKAQRLLREVHLIASAYGWHEADILEMTAERRGWYINLIGH